MQKNLKQLLNKYLHCFLMSISLISTSVYADLEPIADTELSAIGGQAGLGFYLDSLTIENVADTDNAADVADGVIELTSDGGLSLALTDIELSANDGDLSSGAVGWQAGNEDDPFYLIAPSLDRLAQFEADGVTANNSGRTESVNTLVFTTPTRNAFNSGRFAFTINQYYDGNTIVEAANGSTQITSMDTPLGSYLGTDARFNNLSRFVFNNLQINQYDNGTDPSGGVLDSNRRTHLVAWGDNNEIKLAGRVTFQTDFHWGVGFNNVDSNDLTLPRKTQLSKVGYYPFVDEANTKGVWNDSTSPISSGLSFQNLSVDLSIGRLGYQPLTFSIASDDGDLTLELAQIPGSTAPGTINNDVNSIARDFYNDDLSKSHIKWENLFISNASGNPVELGGGEIRGLRIHYLNITTCADYDVTGVCGN